MPARAQPSTACLTLQLLVVFWLRLRREGSGGEDANRIRQESRPVGEDEQLGEVHDRACALLSPDHPEVVLVAVYVGQEDDARLVVAGRGLEDVAAQGDGGREYLFVAGCVPGVEGLQGG